MRYTARMFLGLATLLSASAIAAPQQRVIFDNPGYTVTTDADGRGCSQSMRVVVESDDPALFAKQSRLQGIVDGAQAVLAYECPELRGVEVRGVLAGIPEPVYRGFSGERTSWRLDTRKSFQSRAIEGRSAGDGDRRGARSEPDTGGNARQPQADGFNVANLEAGMTLDAAATTIEDTFGVEPSYDNRTGALSMQAGGCPRDYDWSALSPPPQAGWKCLRARFTDQRVERLYLLELIQVVEGNQVDSIETMLARRFGEPVHHQTGDGAPEWAREDDGARSSHVMVWGDVVEATQASADSGESTRYTLRAQIKPVEGATVLAVTLYRPDIRPARSARTDRPDLDLNL